MRDRGGRGAIHLRGVVAVVEGRGPQWVSRNEQAVELLKKIRAGGLRVVNRLYEQCDVITNEEALLLDKLEAFDEREWKLQREVQVGKFFTDRFKTTPKYIDAVSIDELNRHWVIEAERLLNHQAIGQALVYEELYAKDHPAAEIQKVIVCAEATVEFLTVCRSNDIRVFVVKNHEVIDGMEMLHQAEDGDCQC